MSAATVSPLAMNAPPIEKKVNETTVRLQQGDLTDMEVDAFVFYAREDLQIGSGYGTAIQMRGGVATKKELEQIGRIAMGESVITTAGELKAKQIIHSCGPKFQEKDLEAKLRAAMKSSLKLANEKGLKTLAYPPMGTGFYGVPLDLSARVMFETIKEHCEGDTSLEDVTICTVDYRDYIPFKEKMESL